MGPRNRKNGYVRAAAYRFSVRAFEFFRRDEKNPSCASHRIHTLTTWELAR
jgi:hypothetical protein